MTLTTPSLIILPHIPCSIFLHNSIDSNPEQSPAHSLKVMKLHVAFSAVIASSRAGVSLALEWSDGAGDKTTSSAVTFSDISEGNLLVSLISWRSFFSKVGWGIPMREATCELFT